jgi:hypothetical protein
VGIVLDDEEAQTIEVNTDHNGNDAYDRLMLANQGK